MPFHGMTDDMWAAIGGPQKGVPPMERMTLEQIFGFADLRDIYRDEHSGAVDFDLVLRASGTHHSLEGVNLEDVLEQATTIVRRESTTARLRREGLSDEDIARLADSDETWMRGYVAGATETAEALATEGLRSMPVAAAAAEPVSSTLEVALAAPGALEQLVNGDGIPLTLALIHQGKITLC
jgi:hypothetical protein